MISVDARPGVRNIPPYTGNVLDHLTVVDNRGTSFSLNGEMALRAYKENYRGRDGNVLYHGTFRSPGEIGLALRPQQAHSRHNTDQLTPHGIQAVSASDSHKFPMVRAFFHRDAPAFTNFPREEFLLANFPDVMGREITIVTRKGIEAVRSANPTGYVYVLHEFQQDGSRAEHFQEPNGLDHEYRFHQPATPVFVMPVTVEDIPWSTAIVRDTELAEEIHANKNRFTLEYYANGDNIVDIFGDPFFENTYFSV